MVKVLIAIFVACIYCLTLALCKVAAIADRECDIIEWKDEQERKQHT